MQDLYSACVHLHIQIHHALICKHTRTLTHTYAHTHQAWQEAAEAVSGSAPDDADADKAGMVSSWNELAQARGTLLISDHERQARQEAEAAAFVHDVLVGADARGEATKMDRI